MDTILVFSLDFTLISVTLNIVLISSGEYLTFWHAATSLGFENYSFILIFASLQQKVVVPIFVSVGLLLNYREL